MRMVEVALLLLAAVAPLALVALTAYGAHRRGNSLLLSGVAGLAFPITWVTWYLRHERPYRT